MWRAFLARLLIEIVFDHDLHGQFALYVSFDILIYDTLPGAIRHVNRSNGRLYDLRLIVIENCRKSFLTAHFGLIDGFIGNLIRHWNVPP